MTDGAGTNHFVTLMIFMNYSCILENRYTGKFSLVYDGKHSLELGLVYAKGSRIPAAHTCTHPNISKVPTGTK